jgi:hypothetical protein
MGGKGTLGTSALRLKGSLVKAGTWLVCDGWAVGKHQESYRHRTNDVNSWIGRQNRRVLGGEKNTRRLMASLYKV